MSAPNTIPAFKSTAFNCPFCGAFANQKWHFAVKGSISQIGQHSGYEEVVYDTRLCTCSHCKKISIWVEEKMVFPFGGAAPLPNSDMPEDIKKDYEEARSILSISPKSSAALLRLALQKLCIHLGEPGANINTDIKNLVIKKNLPIILQQALDAIRIVGNNAVHPGEIDLNDDSNTEIVTALFSFLNMVVESQITQPKRMAEIYSSLPAGALAAVAKRDGLQP